MMAETMQFNSTVVVYVNVFLLCYCKHGVIMQQRYIAYRFLYVKLRLQIKFLPFEHGQVAFLPSKENIAAFSCKIHKIRAEFHVQVENFILCSYIHFFSNVFLFESPSSFHSFSLEVSCIFCQENFRTHCAFARLMNFFLVTFHCMLQPLVLDWFRFHLFSARIPLHPFVQILSFFFVELLCFRIERPSMFFFSTSIFQIGSNLQTLKAELL
mmetsp:Transcript_9316/g.15036  ORF Transcript_9316/g.15036 Transcript_9316/m.15036 type:complete len:212 (+) Transcript_9316:262-897(+)